MKRALAVMLCLVLTVTVAGSVPVTRPAEPAPAAGGSDRIGAERAALTAARRAGRPVEVTALTSPTTQVFAHPDGTMHADVKTSPVRVRRGDGWAPIDTTLTRHPDGHLAPRATAVEVRISGGGDGPFATVVDGARRVELSWPGPLPRPRLDGDSATYPNVLPDVDLVVTATPTGFREKLVVHTPEAARHPAVARIQFGLRTENWSLRAERLPAFMWDSAPRARKHPMRVRVSAESLTVVPDSQVLSDPDLVYPLHLDPEVQTPRPHWTMTWSEMPSQSFYDSSYHAQVGRDPNDPAGGRWRSYFTLDTSFTAGKHILSATFRATLLFSHNCAAQPVYLWHTGPINANTAWMNQPGRIAQVGAAVTTIKAGHEACPGSPVAEFDATSLIAEGAAQSRQQVTVALVADEGPSSTGGKLFENDSRFSHKVPAISVVYNSVPGVPEMLPTATMPGCAGSPHMWVATTTPQLAVAVADDDPGDRHGVDFEIREAGASELLHAPRRTASGTYQYDVPDGVLADGGRYEWRARATDDADNSAYGPWCPFTVDVVGPSGAPEVTSGHFLPIGFGQPMYGIRVDQVGQFRFDSGGDPDVAGFDYEIRMTQRPPERGRVPASAQGTATLDFRPLSGGFSTNEIWVWAVDKAGNRGPRNPRYMFRVQELPAAVDLRFNELQGDTAADTAIGGADGTLTFDSGVSWVDGRVGSGIRLDGSAGAGGLAAQSAVDTAGAFSVTAWARLLSDATDNDWTLNLVGHSAGGFALRYQKTAKRWQFATRAGAAAGAPEVVAASDTIAQAGIWTHLAGVHDPDAGQLRLYVNGRLAGTAPFTTPWTATAPLRIGPLGDSPAWTGDLDDISIFEQALSEEKVRGDMGLLEARGGEGHWRFDESEGIAGADSSGSNHTSVLYSDASWAAARHGGGARFAGGWAHTDQAVISPDASYTVAAWVKLDRLPGQDQYIAVSQDGRWDSRFKLGVSRGWGMPNGWMFAVNGADTPDDTVAGSQPVWVQGDIGEQVGVWTHLAGVFDGAAGQIRLYVNGRLGGTAAFTGGPPAVSSLVFGRWQNEGFRVGAWPGIVDDVRVAQRALSAAEVTDWMDWPGKYGPNARWTFDEGAGTVAHDASDNDHSLALIDRTGWLTVPTGKALRLEGQASPDWAFDGALGRTARPVVPAGRSFTVAGWGRLDSLNASATLVSQDGVNDSGFSLMYDRSASAWSFRMAKHDSLARDEYAYARGGIPQARVWTHLAGVYDHTAGTLRLYVDGFLVTTTNYRATWFADRAFVVGRDLGGGFGAPLSWWKGDVDDVHVLDHAATATEVEQIASNPPTTEPKPVISVSVYCDGTGYPDGWYVDMRGSVANTWTRIRSASVTYEAHEIDTLFADPTGTLPLSVASNGLTFAGTFPDSTEMFVGGTGVSWTVVVVLADGRSYARSGHTAKCE